MLMWRTWLKSRKSAIAEPQTAKISYNFQTGKSEPGDATVPIAIRHAVLLPALDNRRQKNGSRLLTLRTREKLS